MQYGFYYDQSRCIACNACTVACKDWNQVNPGPVRWRTHKYLNEEISNGTGVFENLVMSCNHCENPACIGVCSFNAITKDSKGIVTVDRNKCQGLRSCITACPFAAPKIADDAQEPIKRSTWKINHPMQKCKMCYERLQDGQKPVCVNACVTRAIDFGDIDELWKRYPDAVRLNPSDFPKAYVNNTNDTKPSFLIKKRGTFKVTELKID